MIFIDHSPSLSHYGVLGMKWGVRKDGMPQGYQGSGKSSNKKSINGNKRVKSTFNKEADAYFSVAKQVDADKAIKNDKRRSSELKKIKADIDRIESKYSTAKTEEDWQKILKEWEKIPDLDPLCREWARSLLEENGIDPESEAFIEDDSWTLSYEDLLADYIKDDFMGYHLPRGTM